MTDSMHDIGYRLQALANNRPNALGRKQVDDALGSKFEGVQITAVKTLAAWGDTRSVDRIKAVLEASLSRPEQHSFVSSIARALAQCIHAQDATWVLDLFFGTPSSLTRHCLFVLIDVLPRDEVLGRATTELRSGDSEKREAALTAQRRISSR